MTVGIIVPFIVVFDSEAILRGTDATMFFFTVCCAYGNKSAHKIPWFLVVYH